MAFVTSPLAVPASEQLGDSLDEESGQEEAPEGKGRRCVAALRARSGRLGTSTQPLWSKRRFLKASLAPDLGTAATCPQQHPLQPALGREEGERERVQLQPGDLSDSRRRLANLSLG